MNSPPDTAQFETFYRRLGFLDYPFSVFTAEAEREKLKELFVKPNSYAPILETIGRRSTVVISGERGTGKTALLLDLERRVAEDCLLVKVYDFSRLPKDYKHNDLYRLLLDELSEQLFIALAERRLKALTLSKDDKLLLSYLLKFHTTQLSKQRIAERLRTLQLGLPTRLGIWVWNLCRTPANVGATALVDSLSELIAKSLGVPLHPASGIVREYFPRLSPQVLEDMEEKNAHFALLTKVCDLSKRVIGNGGVLFLIDKVDEDPKLEGDAEEVASFLHPLFVDLRLLLHADAQFVISTWSVPLEFLRGENVRFQKLTVEHVSWSKPELEGVLNKRVDTFSGGEVRNYRTLFAADVSDDDIDALFRLANRNPRDLWHILDKVLRCQFEIDPFTDTVCKRALQTGSDRFVRQFNFYEYYPRNAKARANSMDIYSYIAHLQKLGTDRFTKNELNVKAGTGGSTSNYVTQMKNIGLIAETDERGENGAVVYAIRDPKVIHAARNNIEINRS